LFILELHRPFIRERPIEIYRPVDLLPLRPSALSVTVRAATVREALPIRAV
jgi:hypothetical protein